MRCPHCELSLSTSIKKRRYITKYEQSLGWKDSRYPLRTAYVCKTTFCPCNVSNGSLFWDLDGNAHILSDECILSKRKSAALDSPAKKLEVELFKTDENGILFQWRGIRVNITYRYVANERGRILTRTKEYDLYLNDVWQSASKYLIGLLPVAFYLSVYVWGAIHDKTPEEKEQRIANNKIQFIENLFRAFKK